MKKETKEVLQKSKYLLLCWILSLIGFLLTNNIFLEILNFILIVYSTVILAIRLDKANTKHDERTTDNTGSS